MEITFKIENQATTTSIFSVEIDMFEDDRVPMFQSTPSIVLEDQSIFRAKMVTTSSAYTTARIVLTTNAASMKKTLFHKVGTRKKIHLKLGVKLETPLLIYFVNPLVNTITMLNILLYQRLTCFSQSLSLHDQIHTCWSSMM